ncbi:MAG TPA: cytochrome D1 domain-containing protein [Candidatus Tectomicrobia bacterium]
MVRRILTLGVLGVLVSLPLGSSSLWAQEAPLAGYDPKTLVIVVNRDSSDVAVIDPATDTVVKRIALGTYTNAHMAMLNHDGKKILVSGTGRDRFLVVDLVTGQVDHTVVTGKSPEHFDVTPDGRRAFVGNLADATVSVIDVQEGRELQRVPGFAEPHGFSALPDGSKVYVSNNGAHEVAVLDGVSGRMLKRLAVGNIGSVAARNPQRYLSEVKGIPNPTLTKDGAFAYAADSDSGELAIIDTKTDTIVKKLRVGTQPWRPYNSPDGRWMLVPNNGDSTVTVIDTTSQKIVAQLNAGSEMTGVNFALNGRKAYVISRGNSMVYVFDMQTFGMITQLRIGNNVGLETAATSADGTKIYLASSTHDAVYVIHAQTDQVTRIADVGRYPWGVSVLAAASANYCH